MNMQQRAAQVRDSHPYPSADPLDRLRHTVSVFADAPDGELAVMATNGIYPAADTVDGHSTGLTHGDLRALLARLGGKQVRHLWTFPNGKTVSVIPDPHAPLRWEILVGVGVTEVQAGLTGPQVEARLAEIAAQPKER